MSGWRVTWVLSALLLAAFGTIVAIYGTDEEGLHVLVRATARISFLVFLPVYVAAPLRRLWRTDTTRWLVKNRRYLGVGFFVAHMLHLNAIWLLSILQGDMFRSPLVTVVGGGLAYVLIVAMAFTSSDRAVAWLGPARWRTLHRVGIHYVAFIWLLQWTPLALLESPAYVPLALLMVAAFGIRFAGRPRRAGAGAPVAATS